MQGNGAFMALNRRFLSVSCSFCPKYSGCVDEMTDKVLVGVG